MNRVCAFVAAAILVCVSAIHVHWAAGGRTGSVLAVPEVGGKPAFTPGAAATLGAAGAFAAGAAVLLLASGQVGPVPRRKVRPAAVVMAAVFAARAAGNFSTVGFTKSVRGTRFATLDTRLYSPLCLLLSALSLGAAR